MPDKLTIEQRHKNMAAIRAKDTKPEIIVRKYLWANGFRYRLNHPRLPGKPDLVLRKYKTCIFVNGCFWHGHMTAFGGVNSEKRIVNNEDASLDGADENAMLELKSSECCKIPKSNTEFWVRKIMRNKTRDIEVQQKLASMGWHSITVWECELKPSKRAHTLASLSFTLNHIFLEDHKPHRYKLPEDDAFTMAAEEMVEYNKR